MDKKECMGEKVHRGWRIWWLVWIGVTLVPTPVCQFISGLFLDLPREPKHLNSSNNFPATQSKQCKMEKPFHGPTVPARQGGIVAKAEQRCGAISTVIDTTSDAFALAPPERESWKTFPNSAWRDFETPLLALEDRRVTFPNQPRPCINGGNEAC